MSKPFASSSDLSEKTVHFDALAEGVYAFTAEGDPNTGVVFGEKAVLVFDAQATPHMAERVLTAIRKITDLPVHYVVISHYHAVRTLGAAAFNTARVIASQATNELIEERGEQDWASELRRFPRLFQKADNISDLTRPDILFDESVAIDLGKLRVQVIHPGPGHTGGDTVVWIPERKILFAGDLVESEATPYCGDAYLRAWSNTLVKLAELEPEQLLPGRGSALRCQEESQAAIASTRGYVSRLYEYTLEAVEEKMPLNKTFGFVRQKMDKDYSGWVIYEHCLPFNISRAYDEASGIDRPAIWTKERDQEIWNTLQV